MNQEIYDIKLFNEVFGDSAQQLEIVLDSDIYLVDDYNPTKEIYETYITFLDKKIRIINPTECNLPRIIIPIENDEKFEESLETIKKFLSIVTFENSSCRLPERESVIVTKSIKPQLSGNKNIAQIGLPYQFLFHEDVAISLSEREWIAYSLYREAVNSPSVFYSFFNFYKITLLPYVEKKSNGEEYINYNKYNVWIEKELSSDEKIILNKYKTREQNYGQFLSKCRDSIGHVEILRDGTVSIQPDNLKHYGKINDINLLSKNLAHTVLKERMINSFSAEAEK